MSLPVIQLERPLIYIASLRRTGSTVLSEALTQLPYSFVFREPRLADNYFKLKGADAVLFREHGLDLAGWLRDHGFAEWSALQRVLRPGHVLRTFAAELLPHLQRVASQLGVKEIRHEGWRRYQRLFPDMKIIQTARDPRDLYISLHYRKRSGSESGGIIPPAALAKQLNRQFGFQQEMAAELPCFKVTYETLCGEPAILTALNEFAGNPIPTRGAVGAFSAAHPRRAGEAELHGNAPTAKRVQRWQQEPNADVVRHAQELFRLMPAYCEYWGYRE